MLESPGATGTNNNYSKRLQCLYLLTAKFYKPKVPLRALYSVT